MQFIPGVQREMPSISCITVINARAIGINRVLVQVLCECAEGL